MLVVVDDPLLFVRQLKTFLNDSFRLAYTQPRIEILGWVWQYLCYAFGG